MSDEKRGYVEMRKLGSAVAGFLLFTTPAQAQYREKPLTRPEVDRIVTAELETSEPVLVSAACWGSELGRVDLSCPDIARDPVILDFVRRTEQLQRLQESLREYWPDVVVGVVLQVEGFADATQFRPNSPNKAHVRKRLLELADRHISAGLTNIDEMTNNEQLALARALELYDKVDPALAQLRASVGDNNWLIDIRGWQDPRVGPNFRGARLRLTAKIITAPELTHFVSSFFDTPWDVQVAH